MPTLELIKQGQNSKMDKIINCTPHDILIFAGASDDAPILTLPRSGTVARVGEQLRRARSLTVSAMGAGVVRMGAQTSVDLVVEPVTIPVDYRGLGKASGLPEPAEGTYYVVSSLVADACPDRDDLLIPGEHVRDEHGRPRGCVGLYRPERPIQSRAGLAFLAAYTWAEALGGYTPAIFELGHWRGLPMIRIVDSTQQLWADILPDRGVWRETPTAPFVSDDGKIRAPGRETVWKDASGRVVNPEPSLSWGYRLRPIGCCDPAQPHTETMVPTDGERVRWEWERFDDVVAASRRARELGIEAEVVRAIDHGYNAPVLALVDKDGVTFDDVVAAGIKAPDCWPHEEGLSRVAVTITKRVD